MEYLDPITNQKYIPTVIESSQGLERLFLAILCDAYQTETLPDGDTRVVLKLNPALAPYQICVLPLQKKGLTETATKLYRDLQQHFTVTYDDAGSIGKRYRRQDEIGTPLCLTVDYDTLNDGAVTIRNRDTMQQERVKIEDLLKNIYEDKKYTLGFIFSFVRGGNIQRVGEYVFIAQQYSPGRSYGRRHYGKLSVFSAYRHGDIDTQYTFVCLGTEKSQTEICH